jgi:hypothetical protein
MAHGRLMGPLSEHGFDEVNHEDAGGLPRREEQCGEGGGVFHCTPQSLHKRIFIASAVLKAEHRKAVSFGILDWGCRKLRCFRCYTSPPATKICAPVILILTPRRQRVHIGLRCLFGHENLQVRVLQNASNLCNTLSNKLD